LYIHRDVSMGKSGTGHVLQVSQRGKWKNAYEILLWNFDKSDNLKDRGVDWKFSIDPLKPKFV
jgi:hypothetical protein